MLRGLIKACEKRPVALKQLEDLTSEVEKELRNQGVSEVKSEDNWRNGHGSACRN